MKTTKDKFDEKDARIINGLAMSPIIEQPTMGDYKEESAIYTEYHGSSEYPAKYPLGPLGYISLGINYERKRSAHTLETRLDEYRKLLERAKNLLPEMGALHEEPSDAWTNHPAISYVEFQLEKDTIKEAAQWLRDYNALLEKKG